MIPACPRKTRNARGETQASSVQFMRFPSRTEIAASAAVRATCVGFDHPNYGHMAVMPAAVRQALAQDFA